MTPYLPQAPRPRGPAGSSSWTKQFRCFIFNAFSCCSEVFVRKTGTASPMTGMIYKRRFHESRTSTPIQLASEQVKSFRWSHIAAPTSGSMAVSQTPDEAARPCPLSHGAPVYSHLAPDPLNYTTL